MKKTITWMFIAIFALATANGSIPPAHQLAEHIDSLVSQYHEDLQPGGVIAVLSGNEVLFSNSYGVMSKEGPVMNDVNTLFDIASLAKQFTAYAILTLEREGKLCLDDDIRQYLPRLPDYGRKITIRNLIQHTSGIASTDVLRLLSGRHFDEAWDQDNELELIYSYPQLNFEPNDFHVYSNAGYSLLAAIVENVSGTDFPSYLTQTILAPLGMHSTKIITSIPNMQLPLATGYEKQNEQFVPVSSTMDHSYGGGNMVSSLTDMIRWTQNILSPTTGIRDFYQLISQPYNTLNNGDTLNYTYGMRVRNFKGVKIAEHQGGIPGFDSRLMFYPDHDIAVIMMFNNQSISTFRLANGLTEILLGELPDQPVAAARETIELSPEYLQPLQGSYLMPDGVELGFKVERDTLWLHLPSGHVFPMFAENKNSFYQPNLGAECTFVKNDNQKADQLLWRQQGHEYTAPRVTERIELKPSEFPAFSGDYTQSDLGVTWPLVFEDEKLILKTPDTFKRYLGFDSVELNHINGDRFYTRWLGAIEFTRDNNSQIDGFIIYNIGRLQNIRFAREI